MLSKSIPYKKLGEYAAGGGPTSEKVEEVAANTTSPAKEDVTAA